MPEVRAREGLGSFLAQKFAHRLRDPWLAPEERVLAVRAADGAEQDEPQDQTAETTFEQSAAWSAANANHVFSPGERVSDRGGSLPKSCGEVEAK
jgi:hypothetical protein